MLTYNGNQIIFGSLSVYHLSLRSVNVDDVISVHICVITISPSQLVLQGSSLHQLFFYMLSSHEISSHGPICRHLSGHMYPSYSHVVRSYCIILVSYRFVHCFLVLWGF